MSVTRDTAASAGAVAPGSPMSWDDGETPLVSVLTPSFNQGRWLGDNLRSVACQTYPNVEHIVMDGGSTDGSVSLLEHAGPEVRWRSEPDKGQSDALNKAFAESRGEIIGWINSDDAYFDCDAVQAAVDFLQDHPAVDMVYGHVAYVNASGLVLHMMWVPRFSARLLRLFDYVFQPAVFVRRRALDDTFVVESLHFAMDYELWLRLTRRGKAARIDRVLAIDRVHPERKSMTQTDTMIADNARLAGEYGLVPPSRRSRTLQRAIGILWRFAGVRLVGAIDAQPAFERQPTTKAEILRRQLFTRRRQMPVEGA